MIFSLTTDAARMQEVFMEICHSINMIPPAGAHGKDVRIEIFMAVQFQSSSFSSKANYFMNIALLHMHQTWYKKEIKK